MELTAAGSRADWALQCDDNSGADVSRCKRNGRHHPHRGFSKPHRTPRKPLLSGSFAAVISLHFRVRHPEFEVPKYFASQADNSSQLWIQITPARTAFEDPPRRQPG